MEKKITKLCIFDFDGTLVATPLQPEGMKVYKDKTGKDWPHKGWWSKKESLDMDIFEIPLVDLVKEAYDKVITEEDTLKVMLTGRLPALKKEVETILASYGLIFDEYHYNNGGSTEVSKQKTMEDLLQRFPDVDRIEMFDDRLEHIPVFEEFLHEKLKSGRIKSFNITVVPTNTHK